MPPKRAAAGGEKSTRSVPSRQGQTFRKESYKVFALLFVLYKKYGKAARRKKDSILFVRSRCCSWLIRGSQNLEKFQKDLILFVRDSCLGVDSRFAEPRISLWEGFNFVRAKLMFGCADSRFAKPRISPCKGGRIVTFCGVQKVASGKFLCVGDRRNRENCERT